jgi:hypothetical protein
MHLSQRSQKQWGNFRSWHFSNPVSYCGTSGSALHADEKTDFCTCSYTVNWNRYMSTIRGWYVGQAALASSHHTHPVLMGSTSQQLMVHYIFLKIFEQLHLLWFTTICICLKMNTQTPLINTHNCNHEISWSREPTTTNWFWRWWRRLCTLASAWILRRTNHVHSIL